MTDVSPLPSPVNPAEIKAIALKVKQRLSARMATVSEEERHREAERQTEQPERCVNPLALPRRRARSSSAPRSAEAEVGAPRPTESGDREKDGGAVAESDGETAAQRARRRDREAEGQTERPRGLLPPGMSGWAGAAPSQTWSAVYDVDDGATPAPHLSPRSRECTAELELAPASTTAGSSTAERSTGLGPWSVTPQTTAVLEHPQPGNLQKGEGQRETETETETETDKREGQGEAKRDTDALVLVPADGDADEANRPAAPRGPAPGNHFFVESLLSTHSAPMESVRLSCESTDGTDTSVDWRELPTAVSVMAAGSPDTVHACAKVRLSLCLSLSLSLSNALSLACVCVCVCVCVVSLCLRFRCRVECGLLILCTPSACEQGGRFCSSRHAIVRCIGSPHA
jgi:hypothetical protein